MHKLTPPYNKSNSYIIVTYLWIFSTKVSLIFLEIDFFKIFFQDFIYMITDSK